jgi:hypothetical protein
VEPRRFAAKPRPKQRSARADLLVGATCIASASSLTAATPRTRPRYSVSAERSPATPPGSHRGDPHPRSTRPHRAARTATRRAGSSTRPALEAGGRTAGRRRKARLGSRVLARHSRLGHPRASALAELEVALGGELRVRINDHAPRDLELRARSRVDGMRAPALSDPSRIARRSCSSICAPSFPGPSQVTEWADWSRRLGENWILKVTQRAVASAQ